MAGRVEGGGGVLFDGMLGGGGGGGEKSYGRLTSMFDRARSRLSRTPSITSLIWRTLASSLWSEASCASVLLSFWSSRRGGGCWEDAFVVAVDGADSLGRDSSLCRAFRGVCFFEGEAKRSEGLEGEDGGLVGAMVCGRREYS